MNREGISQNSERMFFVIPSNLYLPSFCVFKNAIFVPHEMFKNPSSMPSGHCHIYIHLLPELEDHYGSLDMTKHTR